MKYHDWPNKPECTVAHEYTLANLRFARQVDAGNQALSNRSRTDKKARIKKIPTIPSSIGLERDTNPFLRPLNAEFCSTYAQKEKIDSNPETVFAHLRKSKRSAIDQGLPVLAGG